MSNPMLWRFRVKLDENGEGDYVTFTPNESKYRDILEKLLPQLEHI